MTQFQYDLVVASLQKTSPGFVEEISQEILNLANAVAALQAENETLKKQNEQLVVPDEVLEA